MVSLLDTLRDVIDPAVRAVFVDGEVDAVSIERAEDGMVLHLVALGETFTDRVVQPDVEVPLGGWVERLRSNLIDFVAESPGGWGQNRETGPPA